MLYCIKITKRVIHQVYSELHNKYKAILQGLNSQFRIKKPLHYVIYQLFTNKYGFANSAEKKYAGFIKGVARHREKSPRIKLFVSMLGVEESSEGSMELYLKALDYFSMYKPTGIIKQQFDGLEAFYTPLNAFLEFTQKYFETRMSLEECFAIKSRLRNLKEPDPQKIILAGVVNIDIAFPIILQKHHHLVKMASEYVRDIFAACDLDGNNTLDCHEFMLLCRCVEPEALNEKRARDLFQRLSHKITDASGSQERVIIF